MPLRLLDRRRGRSGAARHAIERMPPAAGSPARTFGCRAPCDRVPAAAGRMVAAERASGRRDAIECMPPAVDSRLERGQLRHLAFATAARLRAVILELLVSPRPTGLPPDPATAALVASASHALDRMVDEGTSRAPSEIGRETVRPRRPEIGRETGASARRARLRPGRRPR
jgi:hypothetical protein